MLIRRKRLMSYQGLYEAVKYFTKDNNDGTSKHHLHNSMRGCAHDCALRHCCTSHSMHHPRPNRLTNLSNRTLTTVLLQPDSPKQFHQDESSDDNNSDVILPILYKMQRSYDFINAWNVNYCTQNQVLLKLSILIRSAEKFIRNVSKLTIRTSNRRTLAHVDYLVYFIILRVCMYCHLKNIQCMS